MLQRYIKLEVNYDKITNLDIFRTNSLLTTHWYINVSKVPKINKKYFEFKFSIIKTGVKWKYIHFGIDANEILALILNYP